MKLFLQFILGAGVVSLSTFSYAQHPTATQVGIYTGKVSLTSFHHATGKRSTETKKIEVEIRSDGKVVVKDGPFIKDVHFTFSSTYFGQKNGAALFDSDGSFVASQMEFKTKGKLFGTIGFTIKSLNDRSYNGTFKLKKKFD